MHNAPKFFRLRPEPGQGTLRRYFVVESLALVLDIGNEVRNQEAQGSEWFEDLFYKVSDIDIRQQQSEIRNQKSGGRGGNSSKIFSSGSLTAISSVSNQKSGSAAVLERIFIPPVRINGTINVPLIPKPKT
jgi:hypothetical protein